MAGDPPAPPIDAICCPGRGAIQRNLLELSIGEEPDPIPRWREERRLGVLGACQWRDLTLIQQAGVEAHISPETDFEWRTDQPQTYLIVNVVPDIRNGISKWLVA